MNTAGVILLGKTFTDIYHKPLNVGKLKGDERNAMVNLNTWERCGGINLGSWETAYLPFP